ncbi:MAG: hypothetical protein ABSG21_12670 [Spirochaetia bacterium]|jgi:hypothetical protein
MKNFRFLLGLAGILLTSCATVQQNIDARTYLARCRYEYAGLKVTGVQFSTGTLIDSVNLDANVKITNTTERDVALDHADLSFFLDKNPVLDMSHKNFVRIVPRASSTETVAVGLPFAGILKSLGHRPQTLGIKAKLWVTLLVGKDTWETPVVIPLEVEVPVPYDQIDVFVAQKQQQLEDEAAAQARKAAEAAKESLPSVKVPHL